MIDLSKLTIEKKSDIINPLAIFSSLPNKSEKYNGYLRNVQGEVLNQWFELRNNRDNIIKMNTGVNVNMELDKNVNLGIGQFVSILFSLIDIIKLSLLKIDRS